MFDVSITYYKDQNGTIVGDHSPSVMFTIPSNNTDGFPVNNPVVSGSEDSSDSFDFQMDSDSPYYDALIPMKTRITVEYDGTCIFHGRVLTVNGSTIYHTKSVHCEGAYSFLNDSLYEAVQEKNKKKISYNTYLSRIIFNHNTMVGSDTWKQIQRGTTTVNGTTSWTPTDEEQEFEPSSWTDTMSLIRNLTSELGGHTRIRYQNDSLYLDWYKYYARDAGNGNRPVVSIGKNILDISTDNNIDNVFTRVIPIGKSNKAGNPIYIDGYTYTDKNGTQHTHSGKYMPVTLMNSLYTDGQLNDEFHKASDYANAETNYGIVYKTQSFDDAETQEQLWNKAKKWVKDSFFGMVTSFTIKAIDMHIKDPLSTKILIGDCVDIYYLIMENGHLVQKYAKMICKNIRYDLFNPENNSYTFGIPSDLLKHTYSDKKKTVSSSVSGGSNKKTDGGDDGRETNFDEIYWLILSDGSDYGGTVAANSFWSNGEMSGTEEIYDPQSLHQGEDAATLTPERRKEVYFTVNVIGKITKTAAYPTGKEIWIGHSELYGTCGYEKTYAYVAHYTYKHVVHWFSQKKGIKYIPTNPGQKYHIKDLSGMFTDVLEDTFVAITDTENTDIKTILKNNKVEIDSLFDNKLKKITVTPELLALGDIVNGDFKESAIIETIQNSPSDERRSGLIRLFDQLNPNRESIQLDAASKIVKIETDNSVTQTTDNSFSVSIKDYLGNQKSVIDMSTLSSQAGAIKITDSVNNAYVELNSRNNSIDVTNGDPTTNGVLSGSLAATGLNLIARKSNQNKEVVSLTSTLIGSNIAGCAQFNNVQTGGGGGSITIDSGESEVKVTDGDETVTGTDITTYNQNGIISKQKTASGTTIAAILGSQNDSGGIFGKLELNNGSGSNTINANAKNETVSVGKNSGQNFAVVLNDTVTYEDEDGNTQTRAGFVSADDFHLASVPSFKTKLAVIDTVIANQIYTRYISALQGRISTLETSDLVINGWCTINQGNLVVQTRSVLSGGATIGANQDLSILSSGSINFGQSTPGSSSLSLTGGILAGMIKSFSVNEETNTLTLTPFVGDPVNFSKAAPGSERIKGGWNNNVFTVGYSASGSTSPVSETIDSTFGTAPQSPVRYYIGATHLVGSNWPTIRDTLKYFKLGALQATPNKIQILKEDGSAAWPGTPSYDILLETPATVTNNGTITPSAGYNGLASVTVNIPKKCSVSWNNNALTASYDANGASSNTVYVDATVAQGYQESKWYAYARRWTASATTPVEISGTKKQVTIENNGDNSVKLMLAGSATGLTFAHNKYSAGTTAGYNSAHVTGSWSSNVYTYSKTNSSSASNSASLTINSAVAMQSGECYAYATTINPGSSTPTSVANTSKKLTIVNSGDNAVKLQVAGSDVGLTFTHNKYSSGYSAGRTQGRADVTVTAHTWNAISGATTYYRTATVSTTGRSPASTDNINLYLTQGSWSSNSLTVSLRDGSTSGTEVAKSVVDASSIYQAAWIAGWNAYYNDTIDWYPSSAHPSWQGKAWIPKGNGSLFYPREGKGDGSSTYCEEWSAVSTSGGSSTTCNHKKVSGTKFTCSVSGTGTGRYYTLTANITSTQYLVNGGQYILYV